MESEWIYKKKYHIELSNVDFTKALKLSALFNCFQDIASEAVESLGIGINTLEQEFGVAWILIRIRVDIVRTPVWNEDIWIETWHQESKKLEFERDFIVRDSNGSIIASAVSTWVIVDIKTREIRKTELIAFNNFQNIKERAIDCKLGKVKPFGQKEVVYKKVIGYSDIDFNGHINNSRYIDYIMDCFSVDNHMKYCVKTMEINYVNEALYGDSIILNKDISALNSNMLYIEGISEKNGKIIFKSQVEVGAK
ncbi:acyl-[acyl-carrier-protein] thioesterase [Acetivibrio cellulolyticus]|uniref:acyl-[acyl-carrier-protein] thioesterase n=1 Tax=Acetivibrio cellulolyticus TaxID=35830 RepID=UPI0001E2EBBE|nr:acyl-ACP thioesterase domain-containing protein [Acetivibrio cellulolyticus]